MLQQPRSTLQAEGLGVTPTPAAMAPLFQSGGKTRVSASFVLLIQPLSQISLVLISSEAKDSPERAYKASFLSKGPSAGTQMGIP